MSASKISVGGHPKGFGGTMRPDRWWVGPLLVLAGLSSFVVYATWAAFQGNHYFAEGSYLSPFYSPMLWLNDTSEWVKQLASSNPDALTALKSHTWISDTEPGFWPSFLPFSPALLILIIPGSFRVTCYYYRKAYYRAFSGSPAGCAVVPMAAGKRKYRGETKWLLVQNLHRYALYLALLYIPILGYDAVMGFLQWNGTEYVFGAGVGSLVLTANVFLLASYTFGCHSLRHLIAGRFDCMTCPKGKPTTRHWFWKRVTFFNERHQLCAWLSLFWVMFTDLYVRLVSSGVWTDYNTWS
jgi:hypothetical protein